MATINDLPAELLHHILRFSHDFSHHYRDLDPDEHEASYRAGLANVRSASLVSRRFRVPAQSIMFKNILVSTRKHLENIYNCPLLGIMRTDGFEANGEACVSWMLGVVLSRMVGLKSVIAICSTDDDDVEEKGFEEWLDSPALRELQYLELNFHVYPKARPRTTPQFNLSSLRIGADFESPSILRPLLRSPKLTYLRLDFIDPKVHATFLSAFPALGKTLEVLVITAAIDIPNLEHNMHHLTSLTRLALEFGDGVDLEFADSVVNALPGTLETLALIMMEPDDEPTTYPTEVPRTVVERWKRGGWKGLRYLELGCTEEELLRIPSHSSLVRRHFDELDTGRIPTEILGVGRDLNGMGWKVVRRSEKVARVGVWGTSRGVQGEEENGVGERRGSQACDAGAAAQKVAATKPDDATHHGEEKKAHDKPEHEYGSTGKPITTQADLTKKVDPAEEN
ncbi:hypothetical protein P7C70_g6865, partial [Phenoliferia sp. Uapishka_3]